MELHDVNYGTFQVTEPVLTELILSKEIQRLKSIDQFGVPVRYVSFKTFSRYEHSIGVMLLLRKLGANLEEQVAGLIHDASHRAFSHVVDWALADGAKGNESFQDDSHKSRLEGTNIATIVKKHGIDFDRIIDTKSYTLLECDLPGLCADRVDLCTLRSYTIERCARLLSYASIH